MDRVFIRGIAAQAIIGIYEHERTAPQRVIVDLELETDIRPAARSEQITDALDYESLTHEVKSFLEASEFQLIETLAETLAARLLDDPKIAALKMTLHKPDALANADDVGVIIERAQS